MAGGEIYRVEIPIIVDDQSEAPLAKAGERVNRFQKNAERANERIRKMAAKEHYVGLSLRDRVTKGLLRIQRGLSGVAHKVWTVTIHAKDKATDVIKRIFRAVTSPLGLLGAGAGGAALLFPLKLAGEAEQAAMAMEYFTESTKRGQAFLKRLQAFAAKTPFEFPDVREAAIGLMPIYKTMYGIEKAMDETIRTLTAFGDAAGFTGAGIEGMNLALLGFKQIGSMGKLTMQDLRQVTQNLLIPMDIVLKELGLTGEALDDLGRRNISAKKAMEAVVRALEKNYGGGMKRLSRSLLGLVSTIKDTARLTITAFGTGMAGPVRRILLDIVGLTDYTGKNYEAFQKKLEQAGKKVGLALERAYRGFKRFWGRLGASEEWKRADFVGKVVILVDEIARVAIPKAVDVGAKVAGAFASGFLQGLAELAKKNPLLAAGLTYLVTPGPPVVKGVAAVSVGGAGITQRAGETVGKKLPGTEYYARQRITEEMKAREWMEKKVAKGESIAYKGPATLTAYRPSLPQRIWEGVQRFFRGHAEGTITTRPHLGLVAEDGPEAIIPLSARMRDRALALWAETGKRLGVEPYAEGGGFAGTAPALATSGGPAVPAATVNLNFDLAGLVGQVVVNRQADIEGAVDRIAGALADGLYKIFHNMTR